MSAEPQQLEQRFMQPEVRGDRAQVEALLGEDFVMVGLSGRICDRAQILDLLANEPAARFEMGDLAQQTLAPDVALVTYRETRREDPGRPGLASRRSSLWILRNGRWQMIFHQGTRIEAPAANSARPHPG
jgi:glyoxylase I family protein